MSSIVRLRKRNTPLRAGRLCSCQKNSAALSSFAGSYQNFGIDYDKRKQLTLAQYFNVYSNDKQNIDTVEIKIENNGNLLVLGRNNDIEVGRAILKYGESFTFSRGEIRLGSGSRSVDPTMVAGTQRWSSLLFLLHDGSIAYTKKESFRGVYGFVPVASSSDYTYIWKRKSLTSR